MATLKQVYEQVFGERYQKERYKMEPHNYSSGRKAGGKPVCSRCGLVALNNEFSRWSVGVGCLSELHPQYSRQRKRAGTSL